MAVRNIDIFAMMEKIAKKLGDNLPETTTQMTNFLIDKAYELWSMKAQNAGENKDGSASQWGRRYANTLSVEYAQQTGGTARVYVDEQHADVLFVNMMEDGVKSWNISDALLAGRAVRTSVDGFLHVSVPFRFRTPTRGAADFTSAVFSAVIPEDIYGQLKSGITRKAEVAGEMAGLARYEGEEGRISGYMTFRTVTNRPGAKKWVHPGRAATPVFEETADEFEEMVVQFLENFVKGAARDIENEVNRGRD